MDHHKDIVVALDGSERSLVAVRWAAWQSQLTGDRLVVLHAFGIGPGQVDRGALRGATEAVHRAQATRWLRRALDETEAIPHALRLEVVEGSWYDVLRRVAARSAGLVVLGVDPSRMPDVSHFGVPVVLVPTDVETASEDTATARASRTSARQLTAAPA